MTLAGIIVGLVYAYWPWLVSGACFFAGIAIFGLVVFADECEE